MVAIKLNHTSSLKVKPVAEQDGKGAVTEGVAFNVLPVFKVPHKKLGLTRRFIAPVHSSLTGGGGGVVTHISKLAVTNGSTKLV